MSGATSRTSPAPVLAEKPDSRVASPLTLRRQELRMMSKIYATEEALLAPVEDPARDTLVLEACRAMLKDATAHSRDRRLAIDTAEKVNRRLDTRWIEAQKNATERMKIQATFAATSVRSWQPNGQPPEPDQELADLINGVGVDQGDDVEGDQK